ncbi:DUF2867 domain-containing protein [Mycobacterium ahvazicum]|uniref:DUF2867 domain-containing protein n=1 Tax=Mycobacterium ahvazicum TaxID=1964395 RepID=A0A2K4Y5C6_9MYCO|nr:DUF2867 domain-containing protein [Mycobacterium ahvazicum]SOX51977.1 DUF2867 domain-containing protein [Mycobacterium ahvazicum]
MERLPYIDEHAITIDADREETWSALLRVMCRDPRDPFTVPIGFVLDEAREPERFALVGRHLFAVYRWVFVLEAGNAGRTRLRATTWAVFPGVRGRIYRALVIGTGAHRVVAHATLKRIAAAALRDQNESGQTASDYTDVFEVPIAPGDTRTAEQMFRDALGKQRGGGAVSWIHRHVLRFQLHSSTHHLIGWQIEHSDPDELVLTARGPLMRGELTLRRPDGRRATLTTRVHYRRRLSARMVWAVIAPLHRAVAPRLMQHAAESDPRRAAVI